MKNYTICGAICCILLFMTFLKTTFANEDPVYEFKKIIIESEKLTNCSTSVYFNEYEQAWAKRRFTVSRIKYDVKKTDSLISPLLGMVSFELDIDQSHLYPSKKEAEESTTFELTIPPYNISLNYSYIDSKWLFSNGTEQCDYYSSNSYLSEEILNKEPEVIPNVAIFYWLHN